MENYTQVWKKTKVKKGVKRWGKVKIYKHASKTIERKNRFTTRLEKVYVCWEKKSGKKRKKTCIERVIIQWQF